MYHNTDIVQAYDCFIHPRIPKSGVKARISDLIYWKRSFSIPNRSGEMAISIRCHLEKEQDCLIKSRIDSDTDVEAVYAKLLEAFSYMKDASIIDFQNKGSRQRLYREHSTKVYIVYMHVLNQLVSYF